MLQAKRFLYKTACQSLLVVLSIVTFSTNTLAQDTVQLLPAFPNLPAFERPMDVELGPGGDRIYVGQQYGLVYDFDASPTVGERRVVLDLTGDVFDAGGEGGLQSIAFDPDFESNRYLYVNYMAGDPDNPDQTRRTQVSRFTLDGNGIADPASELVIIEIWQPTDIHNGGKILFGPDGYLYIPLGDGGIGHSDNAQNLENLLGAVVRIDASQQDGSNNYSIPPDNPLVGNSEGWREEIWAWGLRNPWRSSFDDDGNLWSGDVGEVSWEEVNILESGKNYGWNAYEGNECFTPPNCPPVEEFEFPVLAYSHERENCEVCGASVTGGEIYTGSSTAAYNGWYVFADAIRGRFWALNPSNPDQIEVLLTAEGVPIINDFSKDGDGELLAVGYLTGEIYNVMDSIPVSNEPSELVQTDLSLQVFPNPMSATAQVTLHHQGYGNAIIDVYDLLGRRVFTAFDENVTSDTPVQFQFDSSSLPPGAYLVRAQLSGQSSSQLITIVH